jgi:hypothetical protein
MRKQIELKIEVGDANYVKPGEYFAQLDANNQLTAVKRRNDDLTLTDVVDTPVAVETNKESTISIKALTEGDTIEISPSSGKDAMAKVTITVEE